MREAFEYKKARWGMSPEAIAEANRKNSMWDAYTQEVVA